jgi:hypothetical protein
MIHPKYKIVAKIFKVRINFRPYLSDSSPNGIVIRITDQVQKIVSK